MNLRLIFTRSGSFSLTSWLIGKLSEKLPDGQVVTHVGVQNGGLVYSAEARGVIEQSLDDFLRGRRTVYVFEATPEGQKHLMISRALEHLGAKYGFKELPGFAIARWRGIKNPFHDPDRFVCSEFALHLDDETGFIEEFAGLDPEATSPALLALRLLSSGPTFKRVA